MDNEIIFLPLFANYVARTKLQISDSDTETMLGVLRSLHYHKANEYGTSKASSGTDSIHNFDLFSHPEFNLLKNEILKALHAYTGQGMLIDNKFEITTSWAVKMDLGDWGAPHKHSNCMYSCVYYLDSDDDSGDIVFENLNRSDFNIIPTDWNLMNSNTWNFKPEKNTLLIFPANMIHHMNPNKSKKIRYSIACNFLPVGKFGEGDSTITYRE